MKPKRLWQVRSFQVAKAGNAPDECEDAFAWDEAAGLFAIADGATDAAFQRLWARLLVESFLEQPPDRITLDDDPTLWLAAWLPHVQGKWQAGIPWEKLPWHGLNKARQVGGLATFLGLRCFEETGCWQAMAVGDCTLFHLSPEAELLAAGPLVSASEFGNAPAALSSIHQITTALLEHFFCFEGRWHAGDTLLLTTDALGAWIYCEHEAGKTPLKSVLTLDDAGFVGLVNDLRQRRLMRNDDATLLIITWLPCEAIYDQVQDNPAVAAG